MNFGHEDEKLAGNFLRKKYPEYKWTQTECRSYDDIKGIDYFGEIKSLNKKITVQIKTSLHYVEKFDGNADYVLYQIDGKWTWWGKSPPHVIKKKKK